MDLLVLHQNFPGQFRHLLHHLGRDPGHRVVGVGAAGAPGLPSLPGVRLLRFAAHRGVRPETHAYLRSQEAAVLTGQAVLRAVQPLAREGFRPQAILAHPGWGETLFLRDLFPAARLVHFCEYYYHAEGADAGFDPEFPLSLDARARLRVRNALHLLNLEQCDVGVTPTRWQHGLHPAAYRERIRIIHEGIPVAELGPDPAASIALPDGRVLQAGQPVVTYVARNLEPYRGFHRFMRALPELLRRRPDCRVVVVGGDDVSYGGPPADAPHWRAKLLAENPVDPDRVHFLGRVPTATYRRLLQVSAVHVYLTYPFVLSWSLLEALASGCLVVASDTAPVREAVQDGVNGRLVGFFDQTALVERILEHLDGDDATRALRRTAQASAQAYGTDRGLAGYAGLLGIPPPTANDHASSPPPAAAKIQ